MRIYPNRFSNSAFSASADRLLRLIASLTGVSIRVKIMGIVIGFVLILGLGTTIEIRQTLEHTLGDRQQQHGASIGRDLAARSVDLILTNNLVALHELTRDTLQNNEDVRYVFIADASNNVLVHTFGNNLPPGLATANTVGPDERFRVKILESEEGLIRDVAVPVFEGKAGTARIGLSSRSLEQTIENTTRQLLITTALVSAGGLLAAYLLTLLLTGPVLELVGIAQAIGLGNLRQKARIWSNDEIGQLGQVFNIMIEDLAKSRDNIEDFSKQVLRQNKELTVLNTIAAAVSRSIGLNEVLTSALSKILETIDLKAGWIILFEDGGGAVLAGHVGISPEFAAEGCQEKRTGCVCSKVMSSGEVQVVDDMFRECPRSNRTVLQREGLRCHISVPVVSKGIVQGVINLACGESRSYTPDELRLLASIGNQIGIAVENARLWEELKRKEELRAKLLQKVISAQEEERKRIARELHDDTGQALTSLMVRLKLLQTAKSPAELEERASELAALTGHALEGVRDLAVELRPSTLDDLGLVAALHRDTGDCARKHGIEVDYQVTGLGDLRLAPEMETTIYRIVQEALTNVAKHANASNVSVLLECRGDDLIAIVEDDGEGFDISSVMGSKIKDRKLGLFGMQERASLIGAKLTIESQPGTGTSVFVELAMSDNGLNKYVGMIS